MRITQKGEFRENQKIRVICLIGGIRVKDFQTLRKPDASLGLAMAWTLLSRCNFTGANYVP